MAAFRETESSVRMRAQRTNDGLWKSSGFVSPHMPRRATRGYDILLTRRGLRERGGYFRRERIVSGVARVRSERKRCVSPFLSRGATCRSLTSARPKSDGTMTRIFSLSLSLSLFLDGNNRSSLAGD